jgi:hypothetical protein
MHRPSVEYAAAEQYAKAVERHFDAAQELVRQGKIADAEEVAKGAVILRDLVRHELKVER